jgi:folate-binding protein YgfZ
MAVSYVALPDRGVIRIAGTDSRTFLQGLVSTDVNKAAPDKTLYGAFLTPQGKYLHDFFVVDIGGDLFLDCEADRAASFLKRLRLYKLRSNVEVEDVSDSVSVFALLPLSEGGTLPTGMPEMRTPGAARSLDEGGSVYVDPRLSALGWRAILPKDQSEIILANFGGTPGSRSDYDKLRIPLGVADGSRDMPVEKAILLEYGFDELNGVDWSKGCFMGQELTARTKYRGLVRKRLMPVNVTGPLPEPGTAIYKGEKAVGDIRTGIDTMALAYVRLEAIDGDEPLRAGNSTLQPAIPNWMKLPETDLAG